MINYSDQRLRITPIHGGWVIILNLDINNKYITLTDIGCLKSFREPASERMDNLYVNYVLFDILFKNVNNT